MPGSLCSQLASFCSLVLARDSISNGKKPRGKRLLGWGARAAVVLFGCVHFAGITYILDREADRQRANRRRRRKHF